MNNELDTSSQNKIWWKIGIFQFLFAQCAASKVEASTYKLDTDRWIWVIKKRHQEFGIFFYKENDPRETLQNYGM